MRILITGICGFVGGVLAQSLREHLEGLEICGVDNFSRPGSEQNRSAFRKSKMRFFYGDIRNASDLESLPKVDWVIDAAANPSVLAGVNAQTSSRQLMEHNLFGTFNVLEYCKRHGSGLIMLSTSRVYSLPKLCALPLEVRDAGYVPQFDRICEAGLSPKGVSESFSTQQPLSLYGCAKLASELLALEYSSAFSLPVFINRCGVLAGAGQFGKPDQGIFSFWIHSYRQRRALKFIGFNGSGCQVRDCLHPRDLAGLVAKQLQRPERGGMVMNVSGGKSNSISLAQLSEWCAGRFGALEIQRDPQNRQFDVPWLVLDASLVEKEWHWSVTIPLESILAEIAEHADRNPQWLSLSEGS